jgi:diacylglycerol kinase
MDSERAQGFTGGAASLVFAFMKRNVPSIITSHQRRVAVRCRQVASRLRSLVICLATCSGLGLNVPVQALEPGKIWVASWTASPQGPYPAGWAVAQPDLSFALPRGDTEGATDQTLRLIVKPDLWSKTIRLRFANTFGSRPVTLGAVTVGLQSSGGNLLGGKAQQASFSGKPEVVIPAGEELYSDEVALDVDPADPLLEGHNMAVSFFVKGASGPLTWHCDAFYTSYLTAPASGDHTRDKNDAAFPLADRYKPRGLSRVLRAVAASLSGLAGAFRDEAAFRQELALALIVIPLGLWLGHSGVERALLIAPMLLILVVELLNSAIEATVDRIGLEHHVLAGLAKDIGSAAVFVSFVLLGAVWLLVLTGR